MTNEIIIAIISAVAGGIVTLLTTLPLERRKEKREDRLEAKKLQREAFQNRPEMQIVDFKDYIVRTSYGIKQKCDIELLVVHIENGNGKRIIVFDNEGTYMTIFNSEIIKESESYDAEGGVFLYLKILANARYNGTLLNFKPA